MKPAEIFRLGTRKSRLAKTQAEWVQTRLRAEGIESVLVEIESAGDQDKSTPLYEMERPEGPGFFTKQLETALLENKIDLAVHSFKDLPTTQPPGLMVACVPVREAPEDVLILHKSAYDSTQELFIKKGAVIGTSSLRREALLKAKRPDLSVTALRGNVPTRLEAVKKGQVEGTILARAGLSRLALDLEEFWTKSLPPTEFVPAPAQGALAVETRNGASPALLAGLARIHDPQAAQETGIEREILRQLEGGCSLPLGVFCRKESDEKFRLHAFLGRYSEVPQIRVWKGFETFDILEAKEETLVAKTVRYFTKVGDYVG